jgi:hypothetical protein
MFHHATITTTTHDLCIATRWRAGHVLQDVDTTAHADHIAQRHATIIRALLQSLMVTLASLDITTASQTTITVTVSQAHADSLY